MDMIYVPGLGWDVVGKYEDFNDPFITSSLTQLKSKGCALVEGDGMHKVASSDLGKIPPKAKEILFGAARLVNLQRPKVPIKNLPVVPEEAEGIAAICCDLEKNYYASVIPNMETTNECFTALGAKDTLYVVGHGGVFNHMISYKRYNRCNRNQGNCASFMACTREYKIYFHVDASLLAKMLELDGLNKQHVNISLIMCFGGGVEHGNLKTQIPFSQALKKAMISLGFSKRMNIVGRPGMVQWIDTDLICRKNIELKEGPRRLIIKR